MKLLSQIMRRSSFIFEENHVFIEEENPQTKLIQLRKNRMELMQMVLETEYIYLS